MYDVLKARIAQSKYCVDNQLPHFAPYSGFCYNCAQQIYGKGRRRMGGEIEDGISVETAGTEIITGCPYCNRSYCD